MFDFTAIYLPSSDVIKDRSGFGTIPEAWDWIYETQFCKSCRLKYKYNIETSDYPCACDCYWDVVETKLLNESNVDDDV